jgi:hypothetical protein
VQPLVAYAEHKKFPGVHAPGYLGETYDWRVAPGSPDNTKRIQDHYTVAPLAEVLSRVYSSEAHCVSYVLFLDGAPVEHQPRVNKLGLDWLLSEGYELRVNTLIVDVDNPNHADNTDLTIQTWISRIRSALPDYGFYVTPRGMRLIALLDQWVDPERAEEILETMFRHIEAVGIQPAEESRKCRDWTRHMKLPHHVSEKYRTQYISPVIDLSTLRPQRIEPTPIVRRKSERGTRSRALASFARTPPAAWSARIEKLAELCRGRYEGNRNFLSLAIAGALLWFQVVPETVPAIVVAVVSRAGWNDPALHQNNAILTVGKWQDRQRVRGIEFLRHHAAPVADALEAIGSATAEERARALNDLPAPATLPVDVAVAQMQAEMRNAYGLVVLRAQCGLGKSHAARSIAEERALGVKPDAKRVRSVHNTGFSVPNHKLAVQHAERLRSDGVSVRRVFGVLSVLREDGTPECAYAKQAQHMRGGQSIPKVFCQGNGRVPCEYRDGCRAYGGAEGPDDARVTVGPHALLSQIEAEIGENGLLIIDEPPDLLETQEFTVADIELAIRCKGYFSRRYAGAMAPMLDVVRQWVTHTTLLGSIEKNFKTALALAPDPDAWNEAVSAVGTGDPLEAARLAFPEDHTPRLGHSPPIEPHHILQVRESQKVAKDIGEASRVLWMLWNACREGVVLSTRVEEYPDKRTKSGMRRVLLVTGMRTELADALTSPTHPTVVLDANADLQVPIYQRVVTAKERGGVPKEIDSLALRFRYREFYAADGAPVERTMVMWGASRKAWLVDGQLTDAFVNAVDRAVRWVLERPEQAARVCLVSFPVVEVALRAALGHQGAAETWEAKGQEASALAPLVERLKPILARLPGTLELAHYGDLRGLDQWKDADALVTLGDPVQNLGAVRHDAMFIGLPDPDERVHGLTRAELEQAHGRLRTVHRTKPARSLHIGRVLPGGWHGAKIMGRSRAEDWARGGEMGAIHGAKGAEHGPKGAQFGHLGAEHGIKGKEFGALGAEHGVKGAAAGAAAAAARRNQSDMTAGEVQVLVSMIGGNAAACETLGVSVPALMRYKNGTRAIPQDLANRLRELAMVRLSGPPTTPVPNEYYSSLDTPGQGGPDNRPANDTEDAAE